MINSARKLRYGFTLKRKLINARLRGFTLIELLIVIAIIGILAAAVLIAVNPAKRQKQAKDSQVKSDIGSIATALQAYYTSPGEGKFPPGEGDGTAEAAGLAFLETNQDLKTLPAPPTGSDLHYSYVTQPGAPAACDNVAGNDCDEAAIYAQLQDPNLTIDVDDDLDTDWCWKSTTGKAEEVEDGACTLP